MVLLVHVLLLTLSLNWVHGEPQVPCYFIFGDSLYDNGNNNPLPVAAKSNYPPYGIDFPLGPTGRFCNGRTTADITTQLLGFDNFIPSFATARGQEILKGVNYASGGAGIRSESGRNLGARISMDQQLLNHQTIVNRISGILLDKNSAASYLNKCIYSVGMGNNDYNNNYFMPQLYPTSHIYTPEQYATVLIQQFCQQLKTLYKQGARKIVLFGLAPIGCTPSDVALYGTNGSSSSCVDYINNAVQLFNTKLISLTYDLNSNLKDAKFIYVNMYGIYTTSTSGFSVTNAPCCEVALRNGVVLCSPGRIPCNNRSEYLWWDGVHPSEAFNVISATRSHNAQSPDDAFPTDIQHLVQL